MTGGLLSDHQMLGEKALCASFKCNPLCASSDGEEGDEDDEMDGGGSPLECKKCGLVFETEEVRREHAKSHYKTRKYCGLCKVGHSSM